MKKILVAVMVILLSACSLNSMATPKQKVADFLDKYKNQDKDILDQLDETINSEYTDEDYRTRYRTLMTNQYKNMEYKIKDEIIEDDNAVVEVEVTVYDYASSIKNSNDYLNEHSDEFMLNNETTKESTDNTTDADDETTKERATDSGLLGNYDESKFTDYKLTQMENVKDTVTYTIEFTLTKVNGEWQLDSLSNADIEKLHGIYVSQD